MFQLNLKTDIANLLSTYLVNEREELVLDTRDGSLVEAVTVDGVHEVISGLDGVPGVSRVQGGRGDARHRSSQEGERHCAPDYRHLSRLNLE